MAVGSSLLLHIDEIPDWSLPIWREAMLGVDWLRLRASRVYYGLGIPRGDKSPVVVIPGFMGHDCYLLELYLWLWRIGYKPYMSKIGQNAECPNILIERLLATIDRAYEDTGKPVHLIGHSLGGVLALGAASLNREVVGRIITLGSPIRGPRVHPFVLRNAQLVRNRIRRNKHRRPAHKPFEEDCFTYGCACGFACSVIENLPKDVPHLAVYTRSDGIVDWKASQTGDKKRDAEVAGTHIGLVWNAEVYRLIAGTLACGQETKKRRTTATPGHRAHAGNGNLVAGPLRKTFSGGRANPRAG
ncbi:MAG: alpha/beta fold hydrolase [Candidatus Hydrogenedentes bacterium]|nr:alpha/beta fold hydrolase [Candidatus Hydrogenedentota bacterium]